MDIKLRPEAAADYRETESIIRDAFFNHFVPGCCEHYLMHIMRGHPDFLPEFDFVALDGDRIIGNVVYAKAVINGDDGKEYKVLSLGPLAVLPEYQRRGIGSRLIAHTKNLAREAGYRAILLYGDPDYYFRQGFSPAEKSGIRTADDMYADALLVCELYENALSGVKGRYVESTVYEIDESAAAEFDKGFPFKEKISGINMQKKFETLVTMRRKAFL